MFANVLQMFYFTCNHGLTDKNRTIVMETSADDELPADLELSETNGKKRPSEGTTVAGEPTSPPAEIAPSRRRCQIVATARTESAATEDDEGLKETSDGKTVKFVPRPAVPTLSRAEILLKQAEDISVRGNPCISSRKPQNQLLVRALIFLMRLALSVLRGVYLPNKQGAIPPNSPIFTSLPHSGFSIPSSSPSLSLLPLLLRNGPLETS